MKESLFYTFLALFSLTFFVTLAGILKKDLIDRQILKLLIAAFIIELGASVVGLYKATDFFSEDRIKFKPNDVAIEFKFSANDWLAVGHYSVTKSRAQEAISAYNKYLIENKNSFEAWYGLGLAYLNSESYEKAYLAFKSAYEVRNEPAAHINAGISAKNLGDFDVAIREYEKAITLNSEISKTWYNYGNLYFDRNEFAKAAERYESAIQRDSQYSLAWQKLTESYYNLRKRAEFLRALESAIRLNDALRPKFKSLFPNYADDSEFKAIIGD